MSLEISNKNIDTTKEQKRTGFADLKHTKTVNAKETITLKKTLIMTNRKSVITDSDNVFEVLFAEDPGEKENYMFIGRSGLPFPDSKQHASYVEITANTDTSKPAPQAGSAFTNGRITMALTHDKPGTTQLVNFDIVDSVVLGRPTGSVAVYMLARGDDGLSGIGYEQNGQANINLYNLAHQLYLGGTILPDSTNAYDIGDGTHRIKTIYTVNAVNVSSDIRFKKNVKKLKYGLKEVKKINPISFSRDGIKHLGFSAQELRKVLPEVVTGNLKTQLGIRPDELVPVLFSAIRELSDRLDAVLAINGNTSKRLNRKLRSRTDRQRGVSNKKKGKKRKKSFKN